MHDHLRKLSIEVSNTLDGQTYVQISTPGIALPVNIVLVADEVEITDTRATDGR